MADIDAVSMAANGDLLLSVDKITTIGDLVVDSEDVVACVPISLGGDTRCDFASTLHFDGSLWVLDRADIDGLEVP